jgi:hypothetical protein
MLILVYYLLFDERRIHIVKYFSRHFRLMNHDQNALSSRSSLKTHEIILAVAILFLAIAYTFINLYLYTKIATHQ